MYRWKALVLVVGLSFAVVTAASAQMDTTHKGNYLVGGAMSWSSVDNDNATDRINTFTVAPTGMFFVADNIAVGTVMNFTGLTRGDFGNSVHRYLAVGQYVISTSNAMMRPVLARHHMAESPAPAGE